MINKSGTFHFDALFLFLTIYGKEKFTPKLVYNIKCRTPSSLGYLKGGGKGEPRFPLIKELFAL